MSLTTTEKLLLTDTEVLTLLNVDTSKNKHPRSIVLRLYRDGYIKGRRVGRRLMFSRKSVMTFLESIGESNRRARRTASN